eukprot:4605525-Amphidinium_carterae.1
MPLQGAQKDAHAPRHFAWQRIVTRPGIALRRQNFRLVFGVFTQLSTVAEPAIFNSAFLPSLLNMLQQAHNFAIFYCCTTNELARPGKRIEANDTPIS